MTLCLILTRHAKSSWGDPTQADHDRPLNKRGQRAAPAIAQWLAKNGRQPAEVVSSTARRALETWERMAPAFASTTLLRRDPTLYHASADTMLETLRSCAASPAMLIGHNPGIGEFAARILMQPPRHPRFRDYPTCATLVAEFDTDDWARVEFGTGRAVDFAIPADLGVRK